MSKRRVGAGKRWAELIADRAGIDPAGRVLIVIATIFVLFSIGAFFMITQIEQKRHQNQQQLMQAMERYRFEQIRKIRRTCDDRGGVESWEYSKGFICNDGTAHKLPQFNMEKYK